MNSMKLNVFYMKNAFLTGSVLILEGKREMQTHNKQASHQTVHKTTQFQAKYGNKPTHMVCFSQWSYQ